MRRQTLSTIPRNHVRCRRVTGWFPGDLPMRILLLLGALLIGMPAPAGATDDVAAAQAVISAQAEAFGRDDAAAAYGHAAPAIRQLFPEPDIFMNMVRNG